MAAAKGWKRSIKIFRQNTAAILISAVVLVLLAALLLSERQMQQKIAANEKKRSEVQLQIDEQEQRTAEIQELEEYMQSQEYIEKVAKDKLGLIKDGEIIFKEQ